MTSALEAQLSSTVGGGVQQIATQCTCACPPGPNGCPNYCDRETTAVCAESQGVVGSFGTVVGIACSDYGLLRARAEVHPASSTHIDFRAAASFEDAVTLQGGSGTVLVRAYF